MGNKCRQFRRHGTAAAGRVSICRASGELGILCWKSYHLAHVTVLCCCPSNRMATCTTALMAGAASAGAPASSLCEAATPLLRRAVGMSARCWSAYDSAAHASLARSWIPSAPPPRDASTKHRRGCANPQREPSASSVFPTLILHLRACATALLAGGVLN